MRLVGLVGLGSCVPSLSAPTAYRDEVEVCGDPAAYAARVDACEADAACAGIASLSGTIEGTPFVLTSALHHAVLRKAAPTGVLAQLDLFGAGPYFAFALVARSLGGALDGTAPERELAYAWEADTLPDDLDDDAVTAELRVSIPLRTIPLEARPGSGSWIVEAQTDARVILSFDGRFGPMADEIRGCATVRPIEVRLE